MSVDIDLAILELEKDAAFAEYEQDTRPWHAMQTGALGALGVGMVAFVAKTLPPLGFLTLEFLALGFVFIAQRGLHRRKREFLQELEELRNKYAKLKSRAPP